MGRLNTGSRLDSSRILLGVLGGTVAILDQTTKAVVRAVLPLYDSIEIIPGLLSFTHARNYGVAFGFLNNVNFPFKTAFMTLVALTALTAISIYAMRSDIPRMTAKIGLALVIGGAVGNLIDRITAGYVVDFIDLHVADFHWPAFNIADSFITAGIIGLILAELLNREKVAKNV